MKRFIFIALLALTMPTFAQDKPAAPLPGATVQTPSLPATTLTVPAAAKEETKPLDEVTLLRLQNGILRIQKAQSDITVAQMEIAQANEQANRELEKFYKANGLVQDEWILDQQRIVLVKKPKQ